MELLQSGDVPPQRYLSSSLAYDAKLSRILRGWVITKVEKAIIAKWAVDNYPNDVCRDTRGELDVGLTHAEQGSRFVRHHLGGDWRGGVDGCQAWDGPANMVYINCNDDTVPGYMKPEE